jgi:hypothetical protein
VGSLPVAIEHVGSTAVPGLVAKPILDIALAFPDRASLDEAASRLSVAGYEWRGDFQDEGGVVFVEGPTQRGPCTSILSSVMTPNGKGTFVSATCSAVTVRSESGTRRSSLNWPRGSLTTGPPTQAVKTGSLASRFDHRRSRPWRAGVFRNDA